MSDLRRVFREMNGGEKISIRRFIYYMLVSSPKCALFRYRIIELLYNKGYRSIANIQKKKMEKLYGMHISLRAKIGYGIKFPHANGVVIGSDVVIGKNCTIYQQVTLGGQKIGDGKNHNYPIVDDDVVIYAGAKILGNVKIGKGAVIGANSVVIKDVEPYSVYAGVPAKRIDGKGEE